MTESLRQKFGARVRQLRKARRWTQEKLAENSGMEYKHLGAIEWGEKNVTINKIEKIARGLEVGPYQFFLFSTEGLKPVPDITRDKIMSLIDTIPEERRAYLLKIVWLVSQAVHTS